MAVIQFTQADVLRGKLLEAGNYPAEITVIDGPKTSASKKSVTFYTTFRITEGPFEGKELGVAYNTGTSNSSILGDKQFSPHTDLLKVEAAIKNQTISPGSRPDFDTDELLHKSLVLIVAVSPNETGGLCQFISGYLPAGENNDIPF